MMKSTRRKSKSKLNLIDTGVSLVVANAVTEGLADANLMDFITGRMNGVYRAGRDGGLRLTLPGIITGESFGTDQNVQSVPDALVRNFKKNAMPMLATVILAPIAAKMAKKVLRKPVLNPLNKVIKSTGLDVKV